MLLLEPDFARVLDRHWRYIEHGPDGAQGFEGRYREVTPPERLVQTFEWDGTPRLLDEGEDLRNLRTHKPIFLNLDSEPCIAV